MNEDIIKGKWETIKGKVKQQWAKITDDDLKQINGKYQELSGKIQEKYGVQKDEAEKQISKFIDNNGFKN